MGGQVRQSGGGGGGGGVLLGCAPPVASSSQLLVLRATFAIVTNAAPEPHAEIKLRDTVTDEARARWSFHSGQKPLHSGRYGPCSGGLAEANGCPTEP